MKCPFAREAAATNVTPQRCDEAHTELPIWAKPQNLDPAVFCPTFRGIVAGDRHRLSYAQDNDVADTHRWIGKVI